MERPYSWPWVSASADGFGEGEEVYLLSLAILSLSLAILSLVILHEAGVVSCRYTVLLIPMPWDAVGDTGRLR